MGTNSGLHIVHAHQSAAGWLRATLPTGRFQVEQLDVANWPEVPVVVTPGGLSELLEQNLIYSAAAYGFVTIGKPGRWFDPGPVSFLTRVLFYDGGAESIEALRQLTCPRQSEDWHKRIVAYVGKRFAHKALPEKLELLNAMRRRHADHVRQCAGCRYIVQEAMPGALQELRTERALKRKFHAPGFMPDPRDVERWAREYSQQGDAPRSRQGLPRRRVPVNPNFARQRGPIGQTMPNPLIEHLAGIFAAFMAAEMDALGGSSQRPLSDFFGQRRALTMVELEQLFGRAALRRFINEMADLKYLDLDLPPGWDEHLSSPWPWDNGPDDGA